MISVIISSVNKAMLTAVSQNIADTIGVPFEIISFDNSTGAMGICEVYNKGIQQARYNLLCFMHEDVVVKTTDWGKIVGDIFANDPELGLLGVAGATYKPLAPTGWHGADTHTHRANILQGFKYQSTHPVHHYSNPKNERLADVVCVDGVWLCTPRALALQTGFDQETFKSFHAYDLDYSMSVRERHHRKVAVTYDVLLHHLSEGNYQKDWVAAIINFHNKWHNHLPAFTEDINPEELLLTETNTFRLFISLAVASQIPMQLVYRTLWQCRLYRRKWLQLFIKLNKQIYRAYRAAKRSKVS